MNILILGGSGFIGRQLTHAAEALGHEVQCLSRRTGVDVSELVSPADWLPFLQGTAAPGLGQHKVDAVINAVGIIGETRSQLFDRLHTQVPKALFQACAQLGVRRVIQISALGADAQAASAYHRSKRAADEVLRQLDLDWFILRPSLVYGRGGASSGLFMTLARLPLIPVIGRGDQPIQPVHISDLVATVMQCLSSTTTKVTLDVVGPDVVTFAQWLQQMRCSQGLPRARFIPVPLRCALLGARLGGIFSPMLQPDNIRMLQAGNCADVRPLTQFLGRPPVHAAPHLFCSDGVSL